MIEHGIEPFAPRRTSDIMRVDRLEEAIKNKKQLMATVRKHLKLNPKPHVNKVRLPTISDRFNHNTRFQAKPTEHYWTQGRNVPPWPNGEISKIANPFTVGLRELPNLVEKKMFPTKMQSAKGMVKNKSNSEHYRNNTKDCPPSNGFRQKPTKAEHKLNGCLVSEKLTRLQVPVQSLPIGRCEVEKTYFSDVKGRPLQENFKHSSFKSAQRYAFFPMLLNGYYRDEILRRSEHQKLDLPNLERIDKELERTRGALEKFMTEDHSESVDLVQQYLTIDHIRDIVVKHLGSSRGVLSAIKSEVFKLDFQLSELLLCRDLLLKLSPVSFRLEYASLVRKNSVRNVILEEVVQRFSDYCRYNPEHGADHFLDEAVKTFVGQLHFLGPQKIYFKEGWEIDVVMRRMELDCVRQLADLVQLNKKIQELKTFGKELNRYHASTVEALKWSVKKERFRIESLEVRAAKLCDTTNGEVNTFYKQLCSGDFVLEMMALVEVLHEDFFGSSKQKFDHISMMTDIEAEMRRLQNDIWDIEGPIYKRYEEVVKSRLARNFTEPLKAREKFRLARNKIRKVNTIFSKPLVGRCWKIPGRRSEPKRAKRRADSKTEKESRRKSEPKMNYLQLTGIVDRDDLEGEINELIDNMCRNFNESEDSEDWTLSLKRSSLRSSVHSHSLKDSLASRATSVLSGSSFKFLDLDYDSEEELIRNNVEKLKARGLVTDDPPITYDVKPIDDRFMVDSNVQLTLRDKRHEHRGPPKKKITSLSWR